MNGFDVAPDFAPAGDGGLTAAETAAPAARRRAAAGFAPFGVAVEATIDACDGGYVSQALNSHFHGTRLTLTEAIALKALTCSLSGQRARTADGRIVDTPQRTLKWILDQVAAQMPAAVVERLKAAAR